MADPRCVLEAISVADQWRYDYNYHEDWQDILTCAFRNESPRVASGLNGGMVLLGQRTSKFSKKEFSEWMEFLWSVAADRGVVVYEKEAA